jgi:Undecaprenyl-phosphate galactose phosphotransferase WbaP
MSSAAIPVSSLRSLSAGALPRYLTIGSVVAADLFAFSAAGVLTLLIRFVLHADFSPAEFLGFVPAILIFFGVFAWVGLYPGISISPIDEFRLVLRSSSIGFLLLIAVTFFLRHGLLVSRLMFMLDWAMVTALVPLSRRAMRGWAAHWRWWGIPTVILGEAQPCMMMLKLLEGHARVGLKPVAVLLENTDDLPLDEQLHKGVIFGILQNAKSVAKEFQHCYAVLAMPTSGSERVTTAFNDYAQHFHRVLIIPDLFGMRSLSVTAKDICGVLALEVDQKLTSTVPQWIKRAFDVLIAGSVALVSLPVVLVVYLAVKLTSRGPAFYRQTRIGRNEVPFRLWKFRSMVVDSDEQLRRHLEENPELRAEWERDRKLKRDPRITTVGRFLRKTSLDELPQVWNVLCGDMSLVGPRPIVESEIEKYGKVYRQYQRVVPGVTGMWQISGRNNTTYEMRTQLDDYYVRNWSVYLDIYILARTLKTIFFSEGAY